MVESSFRTDAQIQQDIEDKLKRDDSLNAKGVNVEVREGIVVLRGSVPMYAEKIAVASAVEALNLVTAIVNDIDVQLLGSYVRDDEDIARMAVTAWDWRSEVPLGLRLNVQDGWVTLRGTVDSERERNAAEDALIHLMGVRGISNFIVLYEMTETAANSNWDYQLLAEQTGGL